MSVASNGTTLFARAVSKDFSSWIAQRLAAFEQLLADHLPAETEQPTTLHTAMRYAMLQGGKRIRPLLVYAAGEMVGAPRVRLHPVAAALEAIHAYSLVHDDLPAMDHDILRRGKPTVHVAFGEANALLVGDALQSLAFAWLSSEPLAWGAADPSLPPFPARNQCALFAALAEASGSRGMAGGQAIDLAAVGQSLDQTQLEQMHRMKTGALIRAALWMGALCSDSLPGEGEAAALYTFADRLGLLFQVIDDVLDVTADSAALGKTAGKDAAQGKPTFVSLLGVDAARAYCVQLAQQAQDALCAMARDPAYTAAARTCGNSRCTRRLEDLLHWLLVRAH